MAANDAVSMNVAENRQNVPMAIQENRAAVPMTVAEGGGTPGGLNRKADKVVGAVAGNLAGLDANGNLTDSGKAPGDFLEAPATAGSEGQVLTADGEGGASWQDPTGGDPTEIIDDTAGDGDTDKVWSADKSHELLTEISDKPETKVTTETGIDLDITDEVGNVVARLNNGHIATKHFDSSTLNIETASQSTDQNSDLYITDQIGNGIVRLTNGNIQTKKFNSEQEEYKKTFDYTNTSGVQTITHFFPAGICLVFHLVIDGIRGSEELASNKVTYGYTDHNGSSHSLGKDYGYNYFKTVLPADAISVYVSYGTGLTWGYEQTLAFSVFTVPSFNRQPAIVTVSTDGTKDYTGIREAVDAVAYSASEYTPFEIHVYPGTYDILSEYSAEEIAEDGFEGLFLTDGISLIGIGQRNEIILTAEMNPDNYTHVKRNDVSTLNLRGNVTVKNLTVIATNIRYCIHDDTSSQNYKKHTKNIENVKMQGYSLTTKYFTYGAGGGAGKVLILKDCDFTHAITVHNSSRMFRPYFIFIENCSAKFFQFGDYANAITPTRAFIRNCKVPFIYLRSAQEGQTQTYFLEGEGTCGSMVFCNAGYVYSLGDCCKLDDAQIAAGYAIKYGSDADKTPTIATAVNDVFGVSLGVSEGYTFVQFAGYINSNVLGLNNLSIGDYLTIDTTTGAVISGGNNSNAIAKVKYIDSEGVAYAKLML